MIKLYGIPISNNVNKVRYCLNYLGLEYDHIPTNPIAGENKTEEYLKINPNGKIPAMEIDGMGIFESNAINRYLATRENSPIYPADLKKRVVVDEWSDFTSIHISMAMGRVFFNRVAASILGAEVDENSLKAGEEFLAKYLPIVDAQLGKNKYITGDRFTLADINLLAALDPAEPSQISLESYPNIVKWRNDLKAQDFYQKCYKDYAQFAQEMMSAIK